jgi:GntR family transcriptional regulator/MocR family aminotransferase
MRVDESNTGPELLLSVRRAEGAPPLGVQIEQGLRAAIRERRIARGERLPPTRTLAGDLGVSRRVVVSAFDQLVAEGWLDARVGAGTYVRLALPEPRAGGAVAGLPDEPSRGVHVSPAVRFDFFPGHPDLGAFPRAAWARATRDALREIPDAALGYSDPRGQRELRVAIAAMIARTRGVVCRPRQVVICQGAAQALGLLVQAASATRRRPPQIAIEDPYLPEHRDLLAFHGADLVPVPVDELGVHDEAIVAARCDHALLTPAHQCPTGAVLSAGRRAAIARWAQGEDVLLIEDDYDAEYRYNRAPVAALQALAPESVAYLGSASKTLAPAVRLAWLVVPQDRLEAVVQAKRYADAGSPAIDQAVFARLIASGGYDRHLRKARRRQAERRRALVAAVARYLPQARVEGAAAGLHAVVRLPAPVDAEQVRERALTRGVSVYPLSAWYADPPPETSRLVLGYGGLTPPAIAEGVRRLSKAVADSS